MFQFRYTGKPASVKHTGGAPTGVQGWPDSEVGASSRLWHYSMMTTLPLDLQATLQELDPDSAMKLERLVRDAMALAQPSKPTPAAVDANGWPVGHFEKYAGCLAGEEWEPPADPPPEPPPV
jgi:hypothetical protein